MHETPTLLNPKEIVSVKAFRARVREHVLDMCDFSPRTVGRPRHRILGTDAVQMDVEVCARIVGIVLDQITNDGGVLESKEDHLYSVKGRRIFAQDLLGRMSKVNLGVVSDVPEEALRNSLGDLVKIGRGPKVDGRRAQMQYVAKNGATTMELAASWNVGRKRTAEANARQSMLNDLYAAVLPTMPAGVTLGERTAQALAAYHRQSVQQHGARLAH